MEWDGGRRRKRKNGVGGGFGAGGGDGVCALQSVVHIYNKEMIYLLQSVEKHN